MRHHYVPQFLLRVWAETTPDKKVQVFRIDLDGLSSSRRTLKHTGYEDDLYALSRPFVAGMEKQAIEVRFLRHVDHYAAIVRRKLELGGLKTLGASDRIDWVRFLMSLRLRQRDIVQQLVDEAAQQLRSSLQTSPEEYEAAATESDPHTLEEWTEQRFPGLIENYGLSLFQKLVDNPQIGSKILRMRWWLWDLSDTPNELLLSDNPCIFTHGIDDPKIIIALPISPTRAFLATRSDQTADAVRKQTSRTLVTRLNESSLNQARARIYASDQSSQQFIRNRLRSKHY